MYFWTTIIATINIIELLFLELFFVELVLLFDFVFCHSCNI